MIKNGVASLTTELDENESAWDRLSTSMMAIIPGTMQMIAPFIQVASAILTMSAARRKAANENEKAQKKDEKTDKKHRSSKLLNILFNISEDASTGPSGWAIAAASVAVVAGLIGAGIAIKQGVDKGKEENKEK
jgi:phosphate/sulfate permease